MKIRILTQNPFSVGFWWVEQQAIKYIENIRKINNIIDIDFFSWNEKDFDILHVIWIHTWINPYWIDILKKKWVKIIVSSVFYLKPNYLFDFRRPFIYKIFSFIPHHVVNWMKYLIKNADLILPNSTDEILQLKKVFWKNNSKIEILYNWVDVNYFNWVDKNLFKKTYNLNNYILCVSHIEPRKNHLNLIKWFLQFKKNNFSDLKLVLLWDFRWNYFKYHNEIKTLINKNDDILHLNNLSNTDKLFKSAYLWTKAHLLLSSLETPWLSNIESAYSWCKLILWDCKPVREYFKNYAIYLNPNNLNEIKNIISYLANNNDCYSYEQIKFIKNNYTWETISSKLLKYYNNLCIKK